MHAVWNLLLAGARDSHAFAAIVLIVGAIVGAPVAVFFWELHAAVWPFLVAMIPGKVDTVTSALDQTVSSIRNLLQQEERATAR